VSAVGTGDGEYPGYSRICSSHYRPQADLITGDETRIVTSDYSGESCAIIVPIKGDVVPVSQHSFRQTGQFRKIFRPFVITIFEMHG